MKELAFGAASISGEGGGYGFGQISEKDSIDLLQYAFDCGINIFDTAPIYGFGSSEERIGKAFKSKFAMQRQSLKIISKCGVTWHGSGRVNMTNEPKVCQQMLEESLKRLGSEYIDLYMVHWPDNKVDIRFTLEVLEKAKSQGKILKIGLCNTNENELKMAQEVSHIECVQSELNAFKIKEVKPFIDKLKKENIPFMSWGTLDKGILTGRVKANRHYDEFDCRRSAPWFKESDIIKRVKKFERILPLLKENSVSPLEFALHANISTEGVETVLCGMKNHEQVDSCLKAITKPIGPEIIDQILEELNC